MSNPQIQPAAQPIDQSFLMQIEDVFAIHGRDVVAIGRIERGCVQVGDAVEIVGFQKQIIKSTIIGITVNITERIDKASRLGQGIFLQLSGVKRGQVQRGQVVAQPDTINAYARFKAIVHFAPDPPFEKPHKPFFRAYRTSLHIWSGDVDGTIWLPEGKTEVAPGDEMDVDIELNDPVALEIGTPFVIGRFVGNGVVTALPQAEVGTSLIISLGRYIEQHKLGVVYLREINFLLTRNPDTVLASDMAFIVANRANIPMTKEGYWPGAPDLAVQVISPGDSYTEVEEKIVSWQDAGTRIVMIINPRTRSVKVHRPGNRIKVYTEADVLDAGDVVPGWTMPVREIFA